jgi:hypothetical protein
VAWLGAVLCLSMTGCSDDVSGQDPLDITATSGDDPMGTTSGAGPTSDPSTSTSGDPSTSTTSGTGSTGDPTTGSTGDGTTGGVEPAQPSGVPTYSFVAAGQTASSENYRMVFTLGQLSQAQSSQTSEQYRLQGGVVGANGTLP